ncbi:hypothetical protein M9H77_12990 [Catharanthus roseus]|uniref:Uncharacterized protein n=1 Tax=Catharanthus roseus TaxID=4058 RepID=A0ACC0BJ51_CATRO|nr:hypothetical protein M9H77_12990 [Catharanthus roseus]
MGEAFLESDWYVLLNQQREQWVDTRSDKFWEMKANMEQLHIETGSPILTDEQLMFEVASGSDKGHVYSFCSQSIAVTVEHQGGSISSSSLDSVPTLFPFSSPDDDATSQPSSSPPSSSSPPPPT